MATPLIMQAKSRSTPTVLALGHVEGKQSLYRTGDRCIYTSIDGRTYWQGLSTLNILYGFIIDGHHKMQAAANLQLPIHVLTFVSMAPDNACGTDILNSIHCTTGAMDLLNSYVESSVWTIPSRSAFFRRSVLECGEWKVAICNVGFDPITADIVMNSLILNRIVVEATDGQQQALIELPLEGRAGYVTVTFGSRKAFIAAMGMSWTSIRHRSVMVYPTGFNPTTSDGRCMLSLTGCLRIDRI